MTDSTSRAAEFAAHLRRELRTLVLGTVSAEGVPDASVAAAVVEEDGTLIVYVSGLAAHTRNLRETGRASALLAEDESAATQPLARRRLTLACTAAVVPRNDASFADIVARFRARFGATIDVLVTLPDFAFFRLTPQSGRLVLGFGQAFELEPHTWTVTSRVTR